MAIDPLDDMPKIRLDKDDLDSFHRTRAQSTHKSSKNKDQQDDSAARSNSPSWLAIIFLLIMIAGAAGYWSFEQYKVLQQAQQRISELESRLSTTGEDMDQSAAALQVKVSELSAKTDDLWKQMDNLWASAWRRNQTEIGALNKTVMTLKTSSDKNTKSTKGLTGVTAQNNTTIALLTEQLENQASLLAQLNEKVSHVNNVDADFEQQLASLREKLIATALANNDLTNQIDDLRRKVLAAEKKANEVKAVPATIYTPP